MLRCIRWTTFSISILAVQAQVPDSIRQAAISGSRGTSGKCTVEVRVDMTAEVDIYGNSGRLRTLAGQPATWSRMDCTDPLPYNMSDFRFRGVDGRGQVRLVQDPRNNNGIAVIRIDDPKSGSEGYTFDIEWSGASGGAPTDGFQNGSFRGGSGAPNAPGRRMGRRMSAEQAIDLCRSEIRARAERDYNFRNIDITAAAIDTGTSRGDRVTGTFNDRAGNSRRVGGYRFNCSIDSNTGQVATAEILNADGSMLRTGSPGPNTPSNQYGYDQNRALRACQDAVVARTARDGYQDVRFDTGNSDTYRGTRISGTFTASRGRVTDTFDFNCSMDAGGATVRNVELNRR